MLSSSKLIAGFVLAAAGASASLAITARADCPHPCSAQISAVPQCGVSCINSAASVVGCGATDYSCRCASSAAIQQTAVGCVLGACGMDQALKVADAVKVVCSCVSASPTSACPGAPTSSSPAGTTTVVEVTTKPSASPSMPSASSPATISTPPSSTDSASTQSMVTSAPSCANPCAAQISAVPECGVSCIASAAGAVGCGATDNACRCASSAVIQQSALDCVLGACGMEGALAVKDAVSTVCDCVSASPTSACGGPTPTSSSPGGGDGDGASSTKVPGGGGGGGGGSSTAPMPPVVTAGAASVTLGLASCLTGLLAAVVALM